MTTAPASPESGPAGLAPDAPRDLASPASLPDDADRDGEVDVLYLAG
jgi:hypothetical protein